MAYTILEWEDSNDGHLGYKLRKSGYPYMDPVRMDLVATVGPTDRTYTAPPGNGVQFWRVSAYNTEQDVPSDKLGLSFPIKIMTKDVVAGVMNALNAVGTGFGPYHPNGGEVVYWSGNNVSQSVLVTTSGGKTLAIKDSGIYEVKLSGGVPVVLKLADQLSGASTILWAVALPGGKVVYGCSNVGYAVFDPADNSVSLGLARAYDQGSRGIYAQDIGKIILAGTTGNPGTDKLRFLVLDPVTWTIENQDVAGVTGGQGAYNGLLTGGGSEALYWPGNINAVITLSWNSEGVFRSESSAIGSTPAYPSSNINYAQGLALGSGEYLAVGGGNAYLIKPTGVTVTPLSSYVGAAAADFTDNVTAAMRTPDGGFLFLGGGATKFLYYDGAMENIAVVTVPMSSGFWYATMLDGDIYFLTGSSYVKVTWENGLKPPINWPNNYLASQYNCQGRHPSA